MIPARIGSERLKMKNLALLDNKPLITYVINLAKEVELFDKIVINSDDSIFSEIANDYGIDFYSRPKELGRSDIRSDHVVMDFIEKNECDTIVWLNSISPLQKKEELIGALNYFKNENLDSLFTVYNNYAHCLYKDLAINFSESLEFSKTQDLYPIQSFVYSIMLWNSKLFKVNMEKKGHAFFSGKVGYYPVSKESALVIKTAEDLYIAENILESRRKNCCLKYYNDVNERINVC